jgi:hypothetical protein
VQVTAESGAETPGAIFGVALHNRAFKRIGRGPTGLSPQVNHKLLTEKCDIDATAVTSLPNGRTRMPGDCRRVDQGAGHPLRGTYREIGGEASVAIAAAQLRLGNLYADGRAVLQDSACSEVNQSRKDPTPPYGYPRNSAMLHCLPVACGVDRFRRVPE